MSEYAPIVKMSYTVELWEGARRVQVRSAVGDGAADADDAGVEKRLSTRTRRGGKRGRVRGFSGKSMARLRDMYDTLRPECVKQGWDIGLTYPPDLGISPSQVKIDLAKFERWFMKLHPQALVVWVTPWKGRRPHIHLLVLGVRVPRRQVVAWKKAMLARWYKIVGSGDERHLRRGVHAGPIRSEKGVLHYLSTYQWSRPEMETGRCWGVWGRLNAPRYQGERVEIEITEAQRVQLRRVNDQARVAHARQYRYPTRRGKALRYARKRRSDPYSFRVRHLSPQDARRVLEVCNEDTTK